MCREFDTCMLMTGVATSPDDLPKIRQDGFADWLRKKVLNSREDCNEYIRMAGVTPSKLAYFYDGYQVNGYRFHTQTYGQNKVTQSSGVCIKGEWDGNDVPTDYYGVLQEVFELVYDAHKVVIFRCDWFDILNGVRVDREHGIVEVNHTSRLATYEPFVLAAQATQVCYLPYASNKAERRPWWVAIKTSPKARFRDEGADANIEFYQEERVDNPISAPNQREFDWDRMVLGANDFEYVTDPTLIPPTTSNAPQSMARDENNIEVGEEEEDMEQEYHNDEEDYYESDYSEQSDQEY